VRRYRKHSSNLSKPTFEILDPAGPCSGFSDGRPAFYDGFPQLCCGWLAQNYSDHDRGGGLRLAASTAGGGPPDSRGSRRDLGLDGGALAVALELWTATSCHAAGGSLRLPCTPALAPRGKRPAPSGSEPPLRCSTALWVGRQPHRPRRLAGGGRSTRPDSIPSSLWLVWALGKTHLMQAIATTGVEIDPDAPGVLRLHRVPFTND